MSPGTARGQGERELVARLELYHVVYQVVYHVVLALHEYVQYLGARLKTINYPGSLPAQPPLYYLIGGDKLGGGDRSARGERRRRRR